MMTSANRFEMQKQLKDSQSLETKLSESAALLKAARDREATAASDLAHQKQVTAAADSRAEAAEAALERMRVEQIGIDNAKQRCDDNRPILSPSIARSGRNLQV